MLLFCVPHAGASALNYLKWKPFLPDSIQVVPLELAGRGMKIKNPYYADFEEAVHDIFEDFKKSYNGETFALFGHSLGGWLVYELYYKIKEALNIYPNNVLFSGRQPPDIPDGKIENTDNTQIQDELLLQMICSFQGVKAVEVEPQILKRLKNVLENDLELAQKYKYQSKQELIQSPITVLSGTSDPKITNQHLLHWRLFTCNKCTICKVDGNHFFPFNNIKCTTDIISSVLIG